MHDNERTVRHACHAFVNGDIDSLRADFAEDVVVHVPNGLPISGDHKGFDAFLTDVAGRLAAMLDRPPQLEVRDFAASDDHVVGLYTIRAEHNHESFDWLHTNASRVADGRIVELWWNPFDHETVKRALGG